MAHETLSRLTRSYEDWARAEFESIEVDPEFGQLADKRLTAGEPDMDAVGDLRAPRREA
jgi:hypothetical protein